MPSSHLGVTEVAGHYWGEVAAWDVVNEPFNDHRPEVGFTSGANSLTADASTGDVQLPLIKADWSNFDETDDYSRAPNTTYADSPRLAAYVGSALAWGVEP